MDELQVLAPTKKDIRWAIEREFEYLPAVDPAFSPEKMGVLQRMVLKHLALPANYKRILGRVLKVGEEGVGYLFAREGDCALRVESLGVVPEYRRQGHGGRLLGEAESLAREKELHYLYANLTPENLPGIACFEKQGFRAYQRDYWRIEDLAGAGGSQTRPYEEGMGTVRELSPRELIDAYQRWTVHEVALGDAWAEDFVACEQPKRALVTQARHWTCLVDGEEAGYLRIAGLTGHFQLYLASREDSWGSGVQLDWIAAALDTYPSPPSSMALEVGSGGHHQAAGDVLAGAGFEAAARPRFVMIRHLG